MNVNIAAGSQTTSSPTQLKIWGDYTKNDIHHKIDEIYEKIVFWRSLVERQERNLYLKQRRRSRLGTNMPLTIKVLR